MLQLLVISLAAAGLCLYVFLDREGIRPGGITDGDDTAISGMFGEADADAMLKDLSDCQAGDVLTADRIDLDHPEAYFSIEDIDDTIRERMEGKSYREDSPVSFDELCYLKVLHYNFSHQIQVGELVVNRQIAQDCRSIFIELFVQGYEIDSMYLIDRYYLTEEGDSAASEAADYNSINNNNTSGYNTRQVSGTTQLSPHAYGMAIDINPRQNPSLVLDADGTYSNKYLGMEDYVDRTDIRPHMISREDACYQIFTAHGFTWGGDWEENKDYQHFESNQFTYE
jgi:hypothetical protein